MRPLVVKYGASWCKPCQAAKPFFHALAMKYKNQANFLTIDVGKNKEIMKFIKSIPRFDFYGKDGSRKKVVGFDKNAIEQNMKTLLAMPRSVVPQPSPLVTNQVQALKAVSNVISQKATNVNQFLSHFKRYKRNQGLACGQINQCFWNAIGHVKTVQNIAPAPTSEQVGQKFKANLCSQMKRDLDQKKNVLFTSETYKHTCDENSAVPIGIFYFVANAIGKTIVVVDTSNNDFKVYGRNFNLNVQELRPDSANLSHLIILYTGNHYEAMTPVR